MRISDWSSDVCSSDLRFELVALEGNRLWPQTTSGKKCWHAQRHIRLALDVAGQPNDLRPRASAIPARASRCTSTVPTSTSTTPAAWIQASRSPNKVAPIARPKIGTRKVKALARSEEHTSELL